MRKREISPFSLFAMKRRWIENIYHYDCEAKRRQTRNIPLIYIHAFRIRKKEMSPFSLCAMKRHLTEKIYQYASKAKRRQTRYTPLIYRHAVRIRKKGNVSFFLIRYEMEMDRKTYTIMLVRPKDDKLAIHHCSTSMRFEQGMRKREISPFSLFAMKRRWIENIYHYDC